MMKISLGAISLQLIRFENQGHSYLLSTDYRRNTGNLPHVLLGIEIEWEEVATNTLKYEY